MTRAEEQVARLRKSGTLRVALSNFSRNPKGRKRYLAPETSIWPKGKVAKPGRMT